MDDLKPKCQDANECKTEKKVANKKSNGGKVLRKRRSADKLIITTSTSDRVSASDDDDSGVVSASSPNASLTSLQVWTPGYQAPPLINSQISVLTEFSDRSSTSATDWPSKSNEKFLSKFALKADLSKYYQRLDSAFALIGSEQAETIEQGLNILKQVSADVWRASANVSEMVENVCRYFQKSGALKSTIDMFVSGRFGLRLLSGQTLEAFMSGANALYVFQQGRLKEFIRTVIVECDKKDEPHMCLGIALLEAFFRNGCQICKEIVEVGGLDYLLDVCRTQLSVQALLHAAVALSNLAVFSDCELHRVMIKKQVPAWLFVLATHDDKRIQYYGCLSSCIIGANKECEKFVRESGTLKATIAYVKTVKPQTMAKMDCYYRSGRSKEWLSALAPLLASGAPEIQALALYQLNMEAVLRKGTERIEIMQQLGYIKTVQSLSSCPTMDIVGNLADQLLTALDERIPYKLTLSVPTWNCKDVQYWVRKVGFGNFVEAFNRHRVDGDLLLRTKDEHLLNDIKMTSAYERMRFLRELDSLKRYADYGAIDPSRIDVWLTRLDPAFSMYTYQMLINGVDSNSMIHLDEPCLKSDVCGMTNRIHRRKLTHALQEIKHIEEAELAFLRKQVDVFISYRRSTGCQLSSLIKVHLQLKGFKVFIDVDHLNAGQFDKSLLLNIKAAKHFLLILTPHALDACVGDNECKDWVHTQIKTAIEVKANIIPIVEKGFSWPPVHSLPSDIQSICAPVPIQWVHEYQEDCIDKLLKFLNGQSVDRNGQPGVHTLGSGSF